MKNLVKILVFALVVCFVFAGCVSSTPAASSAAAPAASAAQAASSAAQPASAAASQAASTETVKIGLFSCLTGNNAASGAFDMKGAKLGIKDANAAGGVLGGRQLELVAIDSTSDSNQSALILERELASRKLTAMIGNNSSMICLTELPVIEKYKIPTLTAAVNIGITSKGYTYIFRGACQGPMISSQNIEFMQYLIQKSGKSTADYKVGIVYENSAYGKDTAAGYLDDCKKAGLQVVANETYPAGAFTDASPIVTKLKNAGVDLVLSVSYAQDAKLIINTMKSMEYAPLLVGGGSGYIWPTLHDEMGKDVNGIISAAGWNYDSTNCKVVPDYDKIVAEFEKDNNEFFSEQAGETYAFVRMIADAINKANTDDSAKVRDVIAGLTADNCVWFNMLQPGKGSSFDKTGQQTPVYPVIIQWQNEKPTTIWPLEVAANKVLDINGKPIN